MEVVGVGACQDGRGGCTRARGDREHANEVVGHLDPLRCLYFAVVCAWRGGEGHVQVDWDDVLEEGHVLWLGQGAIVSAHWLRSTCTVPHHASG